MKNKNPSIHLSFAILNGSRMPKKNLSKRNIHVLIIQIVLLCNFVMINNCNLNASLKSYCTTITLTIIHCTIGIKTTTLKL